jgi:hypothetical protein
VEVEGWVPVEPWTNPVGEAGMARAAVAVKDMLTSHPPVDTAPVAAV